MRCIGRASECGNDVVLSLDHIPSPENDDFDDRIEMGVGTHVGTNVGASFEAGEPEPNQPFQRASVWWTWTAAASGILDIDTRGSDFDTVLAAWSGNDFATLAEVASNDDESLQSFVSVPLEAGQTIQIAVYGDGEATGNIRLTLAFDPRQAILVAGSTEPPRPDRVMVELLEAAGFDVVFVDDDSDLAGLDLTGVDLLAISSSVKPSAVDGVFADSPVPVLVWEGFLFDELGLASVGRQSARPQTDVIVVGGDHPAAAVPGCTAGCTSCRRPWSPMAPK